MFMWNPIGPIFQIFGLKKINIFARIFAYIKNEHYRKNVCIYKKQIRKQKTFAIPFCLFMKQDVELFFVFQP